MNLNRIGHLKGLLIFCSFQVICSSIANAVAIGTQDWPSPNDPINQELKKFSDAGNYLGAVKLLQDEVAKGETQKQLWTQTLSFYLSVVGDYARAVEAHHAAWGTPPKSNIPAEVKQRFLQAIQIEDARTAICAAIAKFQIVIINENHHHPQHRRFGRTLLPCFKKAGFKYFALEAVGEETNEINNRGHVLRQKSGYYTVEPQMAALIDEGLRLKLKIIRYEARNLCNGCSIEDDIDQREEEQANNLISEIFNRDSKAKVLIWVGYAHAYKRQLGSSPKSRWMAARLWQKLGIEPFTIEQISEQFEWNEVQPEFSAIASMNNQKRPVYVDLRGSWSQIPADYQFRLRKTEQSGPPAIDAIVVHPRRSNSDARHLWLESSLRLPIQVKDGSEPDYLVQIFDSQLESAEIDNRTPIDQVVCHKSMQCELVAPPKKYWVRIWNDQKLLSAQLIDLNSTGNLLRLNL